MDDGQRYRDVKRRKVKRSRSTRDRFNKQDDYEDLDGITVRKRTSYRKSNIDEPVNDYDSEVPDE